MSTQPLLPRRGAGCRAGHVGLRRVDLRPASARQEGRSTSPSTASSFHISSGGYIRSGQQFTIYFTNQPNTCTAVLLIPQQIFLSLLLKVSPPADGTSTATIGPPSPNVYPPSGMAGGALSQLQPSLTPPYQVATQVVDSASGGVTWQMNADGTLTVVLLDMGFAGTPDRLKTEYLTIVPCN